MVNTSSTEGMPSPSTTVGGDYSPSCSNQWGWPPRRGMRAFCPAPRRGMYVRGGGGGGGYMFPGPRYVMPPQQQFYNQRKPVPWSPRTPRLPHFPAAPVEPFIYQQPWQNTQPAPQRTEEEPTPGPPAKKKKKSSNGTSRPWDREAAEKALALELESQKSAGANAIVIRFPDPEVSKEIVQKFHSSIDNVHFQAPCGGRYCFVTLKDDTNVDKVMSEINKIKFGIGYLQAELKAPKTEENVGPENIDPFTLYVGNLPTNISTLEVKEKFPSAMRIDVGYAQKMKFTRYAFVRYSTAEAAFEAYKASVNTIIASRSIILRFRRHKAPVGPPGETPAPSVIEAKPGETLTVGAKLKAKEERAKAEKAARDRDKANKNKEKKKIEKLNGDDGSSEDDEEVELENDDSESENEDTDEADDDDDDDDDEQDDEDEDDDEIEDDENDDEEHDDDDDDDDDDLDENMHDDYDEYMDEDDYKDFYSGLQIKY